MYFDSTTGEQEGGRQPERRHRPLLFYLRGIIRTPTWTFSDIAIDQPLWRGTGLLALGLVVAGLLFGVGGLFPDADGVRGGLTGAAAFGIGGYAAFLLAALLLHATAKAFEGGATIAEELSALTYAALSVWILAPTALLWLIAGGAQPVVMLAGATVTAAAAIRLSYIGLREANRFLGTQAILTMLMPLLGLGLLGIAAFFVFAFGALIFA